MTTFADLMSLLMAFFVLLYAMSSVDDQKFQEIVYSFNKLQQDSIVEDEEKGKGKSNGDGKSDEPSVIDSFPLYESLIETYQTEIKEGEASVEKRDSKIYITFPGGIAFESGSATIKREFLYSLRKLFEISYYDTSIEILGHTDSDPISGGKYRSNWDLSSSRAASVAEALLKMKIVKPGRIKVTGMADTQKISKLPEEKAKDRRIEIVIEQLDMI